MKKLRNLYFIAGIFALVFALLTKFIPGVTVTDFVQGFCYGFALAIFIAGIITAAIPYFYRNDRKKGAAAEKDALDPAAPEAMHDADGKTADAAPQDPARQ